MIICNVGLGAKFNSPQRSAARGLRFCCRWGRAWRGWSPRASCSSCRSRRSGCFASWSPSGWTSLFKSVFTFFLDRSWWTKYEMQTSKQKVVSKRGFGFSHEIWFWFKSDSNLVRDRFYRRIAMSGLQNTKRSAGNSPEGFLGRKPCQTISRSCLWCSTPSALEVWRELLKSIALCDNHCQNYHWCPRAGLSPRGGSQGWPRAPAPPCRGSSAGFPQCSTPWWRHFDWINLYDIISRWCVNVLDLILVASEKILVGRDRREFPSRIRNSSLRKRMVMKLVQEEGDAQEPV